MPRTLRIEYPGAIYHVMNRGDHREPIFRDDADHQRFLTPLAETCTKTDWQVHAFCLMPNHFHLVVETPNANLVAGMRWFLSTYTARFNRRHKLRILREELDALGWGGAALAQRPKGDARKVRMARRLRAETSVTLKWLAEHLHMGTWTHVANRLSHNPAQSDNQPDLNLCQK